MELQGNWAELSERGFLVIKDFLSAEEVARIVALCRSAKPAETHFVSMQAPAAVVTLVADKIRRDLFPGLTAAAKLEVDTVMPAGHLFPTEYTKLAWHTDHKSYYVLQSHQNYVNFWLPIVKPLPNKSGLSVLPLDRLQREAPAVYRAVLHRGAADLADGTLAYELDGAIAKISCPANLAALGETPDLVPGDLLMVRGDVLHRTQDAETLRIALSIRAISGKMPVDLHTMLTASPMKAQRMLSEPRLFRELLVAFWMHGRPWVSLAELQAVRKKIAEGQRVPRLLLALASRVLPVLVALYQRRGNWTR